MDISCVKAVFYSATGSTKKVVTALATKVAEELDVPMQKLNFSYPQFREDKKIFEKTDLVIFGVPVYAGRVPNKMLPYIQKGFEGNNAIAIPVVTFGNRSFDNGLIELRNELEKNQFHTIAGGAFPARHAFSDKIGDPNRPNADDFQVIMHFSEQLAKKVREMKEIPEPIAVRGDDSIEQYYIPLGIDGQPTKFLKAKPQTHEDLCGLCGICARTCPMGAISLLNPKEIPGTCIKCQSCVRKCPSQAKYFNDPAFLSHRAMLEQSYTERCEIELFI